MLSCHVTEPAAPALLTVRQLTGGYGAARQLQGLDLALPAGLSALSGDEGSGKTLLLRLLATDLEPTTGQMHLPQASWPAQREAYAAEVFWADLRLPAHDTSTPLQCWQALASNRPRWDDGLAQALAEALALQDHVHKRLDMLSAGTRRKTGLVAALASGATLTLLDQPFAALDMASVHVLQDFLADMADHSTRAWLVADHEADPALPWRCQLHLG
jgi:ABC-type multidrug transport system ATPase subunit